MATKTRKRQRCAWSQVQRVLATSKSTKESLEFLRELNSKWNKYMLQILNVDVEKPKPLVASAIKSRLVVFRRSIELPGAHVQVRACIQRRSLVGIFGVLIAETTNTWSVAIRSSRRKRHAGERCKEAPKAGDFSSQGEDVVDIRVVCVPKRGSSLDIILPLSPNEGSASTDSIETEGEGDIIRQANESIFISIAAGS